MLGELVKKTEGFSKVTDLCLLRQKCARWHRKAHWWVRRGNRTSGRRWDMIEMPNKLFEQSCLFNIPREITSHRSHYRFSLHLSLFNYLEHANNFPILNTVMPSTEKSRRPVSWTTGTYTKYSVRMPERSRYNKIHVNQFKYLRWLTFAWPGAVSDRRRTKARVMVL